MKVTLVLNSKFKSQSSYHEIHKDDDVPTIPNEADCFRSNISKYFVKLFDDLKQNQRAYEKRVQRENAEAQTPKLNYSVTERDAMMKVALKIQDIMQISKENIPDYSINDNGMLEIRYSTNTNVHGHSCESLGTSSFILIPPKTRVKVKLGATSVEGIMGEPIFDPNDEVLYRVYFRTSKGRLNPFICRFDDIIVNAESHIYKVLTHDYVRVLSMDLNMSEYSAKELFNSLVKMFAFVLTANLPDIDDICTKTVPDILIQQNFHRLAKRYTQYLCSKNSNG